MNSLVTIYMPNYNYSKYIGKAIESVISQLHLNWELIIILDGAIDDSHIIIKKYISKFPDKIFLIENKKKRGLQYCANKALKHANGEYFIRLDPDDFFNESCLLVLSNIFDNDEKVGLVYPDYFYVDENEDILELDNRKKIGKDVDLLDLPAHGACTMLRTVFLKELGGYSEDFIAQDGHDIWYKFKGKHKIVNVSTPLFYYRQHPDSLSKDNEKILNERKKIKRKIVGEKYKDYNIGFVVGAKNTYKDLPNIVLKKFQSKPLIDYTLDAINKLDYKGKAYISTDDDNVVKYCNKFPQFNIIKRPKSLSSNSKTIEDIIYHTVTYMEKENKFYPEIVIFLNVNSPLKNTSHILKAIDTLIIHNCDSVVSVYEDYDLHFRHKRYGLEAISKRRHRKLRIEREALFADNRAINVSWRKVITRNDSRGKNISHIIMDRDESINIKSQLDFIFAKLLYQKKRGEEK